MFDLLIAQAPPPGVLTQPVVEVEVARDEGMVAIATEEIVFGYDGEGTPYATRVILYDSGSGILATTVQIDCSNLDYRYAAIPILFVNDVRIPLDSLFTGEWKEIIPGGLAETVHQLTCQQEKT